MKLSQFNFTLPQERIAKEPPRWRDECRLMVLHKDTGEIEHKLFKKVGTHRQHLLQQISCKIIIDYFKGIIHLLGGSQGRYICLLSHCTCIWARS